MAHAGLVDGADDLDPNAPGDLLETGDVVTHRLSRGDHQERRSS